MQAILRRAPMSDLMCRSPADVRAASAESTAIFKEAYWWAQTWKTITLPDSPIFSASSNAVAIDLGIYVGIASTQVHVRANSLNCNVMEAQPHGQMKLVLCLYAKTIVSAGQSHRPRRIIGKKAQCL